MRSSVLPLLLALASSCMTADEINTSFEKPKPGEIREIKTSAGTWRAAAGQAEVTAKFQHTGKQCLHIFGGPERRIEFTPMAAIKPPGQLVFQAERWTVRAPFAFRIEQRINGQWVEIFNADKTVVVGRGFKSRVEIPLESSPERLRFTCTSPARSGILIDDVALISAPPKKQPSRRQPNVLLIVSEDNGPELGCYGDLYARTPHLNRLAREGVRFATAWVPYSVCSPSRACFLTGRYPHRNGQLGLATHKFAMYEKWPNLFSLLKSAGYRTALLGKIHVNPESAFPLDRHWNPSASISFGKRDVRRIAAEAGKFIRAGDAPFVMSVNFPDAHYPLHRQLNGLPTFPQTAADVKTLPWIGVDNERLRGHVADYYNCLARLDTGIGLLLEELANSGKADNTLVIYLGDHGAQFSRGKTSVYEAGLRVPFIVRWPGHTKAGHVSHELVSSLDILPTILQATNIKPPAGLDGRALQPLLDGRFVKWREHLFAHKMGAAAHFYYPQVAIRDARYKLIASLLRRPNPPAQIYTDNSGAFFIAGTRKDEAAAASATVQKAYATYHNPPPVELYDLQSDPYEFTNLANDPKLAAVQKRLHGRLSKWQRDTGDPLANPAALKRYTKEIDEAAALKPFLSYRRDKNFRWRYLDWMKPSPRARGIPSNKNQ